MTDKQVAEASKRTNTRYRPADPDMLTRSEAAAHIGVSVSALAHWACEGRGPARYVIGRSSYYRVADLNAWIASRAGLKRGA